MRKYLAAGYPFDPRNKHLNSRWNMSVKPISITLLLVFIASAFGLVIHTLQMNSLVPFSRQIISPISLLSKSYKSPICQLQKPAIWKSQVANLRYELQII